MALNVTVFWVFIVVCFSSISGFTIFQIALYRWGEGLTLLPHPATELHIPGPLRGSVLDLIFTEDQGKTRVPCARIIYHLLITISQSLLSSSRIWWNIFFLSHTSFHVKIKTRYFNYLIVYFFFFLFILLLLVPHI